MVARDTALEVLTPASVALAENGISADDIAMVTEDLRTAFTTMHVGVAAAAERTGVPELKARIADYQHSVEQAIVVLEASDGDKTKLAAAIDLPALRSAEKAIMDACSERGAISVRRLDAGPGGQERAETDVARYRVLLGVLRSIGRPARLSRSAP